MTMGPGRSDCYRVGVTYGYREYLRKGRVRQKLRRKFAGSSGLGEFAESFTRCTHCPPDNGFYIPMLFPLNPRKNITQCFLWFFATVYRESCDQITLIFRG
jgi:hypothetical protein